MSLKRSEELSPGVLIFWELSGIILVEETEPRCELLLFVAGGTDWFPFILFLVTNSVTKSNEALLFEAISTVL